MTASDQPAYSSGSIYCASYFVAWLLPVAIPLGSLFLYALLSRLRRLPHAPSPSIWAIPFLFSYLTFVPGLLYTYAITLSDKETLASPNPDRPLRLVAWSGAAGAVATGTAVFTTTSFIASLCDGCRTAWLGWTSFGVGLVLTSLAFWWLRWQIQRLRISWQTAHLARYQASPMPHSPYGSTSSLHPLIEPGSPQLQENEPITTSSSAAVTAPYNTQAKPRARSELPDDPNATPNEEQARSFSERTSAFTTLHTAFRHPA